MRGHTVAVLLAEFAAGEARARPRKARVAKMENFIVEDLICGLVCLENDCYE